MGRLCPPPIDLGRGGGGIEAACGCGARRDGDDVDGGRGDGEFRDEAPGPFSGVGRRLCIGDMFPPPPEPCFLEECEECERAGEVGRTLEDDEAGGSGVRRELVLGGGGGRVR